jgi:hypothetical protein
MVGVYASRIIATVKNVSFGFRAVLQVPREAMSENQLLAQCRMTPEDTVPVPVLCSDPEPATVVCLLDL